MTDKKEYQLDFEAMFQAHVDANQKVWDHDRASSMGASEAFACLRQTWFKKHGNEKNGYLKDPDAKSSWGAMERGNLIEDHWVVPVLRSQLPPKVKLDFEGDNQVTFVYGKNSATPDGLYAGLARDALAKYGIDDLESDCALIEVKSIDPRTTLNEEKTIHHGQAQVQMGIINAFADQGKHPYRPQYCVILYIDASFLDQITVFVVKYDKNVFKAAQNRAKRLFEIKDPAMIPAEGKLNEGCTYCEFKRACAKVSKEDIPEDDKFKNKVDSDELDRLYELAQLEREADSDEKAAKARKGELREEIKQIMRDADTRKAKDEELGFSISWVWQKGKTTYDHDAMVAAGIDLEPFKKEGDGFEKMTVTVKE
jgi:hypothetical protein